MSIEEQFYKQTVENYQNMCKDYSLALKDISKLKQENAELQKENRNLIARIRKEVSAYSPCDCYKYLDGDKEPSCVNTKCFDKTSCDYKKLTDYENAFITLTEFDNSNQEMQDVILKVCEKYNLKVRRTR